MECSRGERLSITLAKNRINRAPERLGKAKVEVDIFELLRDSEYETAETSEYTAGPLLPYGALPPTARCPGCRASFCCRLGARSPTSIAITRLSSLGRVIFFNLCVNKQKQ